MKKLYVLIISILTFSACNDDFLERYPLDEISNQSFWNTEDDLATYNNDIYWMAGNDRDYLFYLGHSDGVNPFSSVRNSYVYLACMSDNMAATSPRLSQYIQKKTGKHSVPGNPAWIIGGYKWDILRVINVFLENFQKADELDIVKNAYAGEARLFRAWFYHDKVKRYGDVPWIGNSLNIDSPELYGTRDPREMVMDSVLADINYAVEWIPADWQKGQSPGRLTKWAALALKSRICLYEGTWRKYHGIGSAEEWLTEAATAAKQIMDNGGFGLGTSYGDMHEAKDQSGNPEVIAWRKYVSGINGTFITYYIRNYGATGGLTKDAVEDYLCKDGKPVALSSEYKGDSVLRDEFMNRDPRLRETVLHPDDWEGIGYDTYGAGPFPRITGMSSGNSTTGYELVKYFNADNANAGYGFDELSAIIFRYAEVLLNYAEAKAELGTITQADLDISINRLRDRVGMPHLTTNPPMDPKYSGYGLSSIIVEIRRERRVELMAEGFRYDDLMRWKWGKRLRERSLGMRWESWHQSDPDFEGAKPKTYTDPVTSKTYIDVYKGSGSYDPPVFDESKHYFWPIPISAISQNPNLEQNPGW
jgi:starch-binding outer membrane protein, SusD/RagB family